MSALPILYSFRRCPYAMRARMAVIASGVMCEIREVVLTDKPEALIAVSPKATVPVMVLPGGEVVDQSLDIMRWALAASDPEEWLAGDDTALIVANDGPFKKALDRAKYPDRYSVDPSLARAECLPLLAPLEERLTCQANLCRETRALTDIAILPFVRQFAALDPAWFDAQPLPALRRWLAAHIASPLFEAAMITLPKWCDGDAPTRFPA